MTKWIGVLAVSCLVLAGCPTAEPVCTPGMSIACVGEGGCSGGQVCLADGSGYGTCGCGGSDAGMDAGMAGTDAPVGDAPAVDAPVADASTSDVPADGGGPLDVGPPRCEPRCDADERCCGADCASRVGVTAGLDGRDDPSFSHCAGCGMACEASTASSCSVRAGSDEPRCSCGMGQACAQNEVCAFGTAGRFACSCGAGPSCAFDEACDCRSGTCTCIDTQMDASNCGAIGNVCGRGATCYLGRCGCGGGATCDVGEWCCAGRCADLDSDVEACGACGTECAFGETCTAGACQCGDDPTVHCTPTTPSPLGQSCCGGACVNNTAASCSCMDCRPDALECVRGTLGLPTDGSACCGMALPIGGGFCGT